MPNHGPEASCGSHALRISRVEGAVVSDVEDSVATEEPLAIEIVYGPRHQRQVKALSVTMRTPGADAELAAGFLLTEGIVQDVDDIDELHPTGGNTIRVVLAPHVALNLATIERNFYMTSSCGVCGKGSLAALETFCPPRRPNGFSMDISILHSLPATLRQAQALFLSTGGLHACGLFDENGKLLDIKEDVGRHNALDKLIGSRLLADELPVRNCMVLFSGRASFELIQKTIMAGIPMAASVGAPSSLAVSVAKRFGVTLVGFLQNNHCNIYEDRSCITGLRRESMS